ncbi:MAG: hypothetical protein KAJ69_02400 [Thermoplasmatales archaeon]|nr:hypothetical protein [Thermoplasmatales archaeon]
MSTMKKRRSRSVWESRHEAFDSMLLRVSKRRKKSIEKIMLRPLSQEVLRCIFIIFIMLLDTFVLLQILLDLPRPFGFILFAIILIVALYVEIRIYGSIWGKNGCWSLDHYRKTKKDNK